MSPERDWLVFGVALAAFAIVFGAVLLVILDAASTR